MNGTIAKDELRKCGPDLDLRNDYGGFVSPGPIYVLNSTPLHYIKRDLRQGEESMRRTLPWRRSNETEIVLIS